MTKYSKFGTEKRLISLTFVMGQVLRMISPKMVKFCSAMENPIILYGPRLKQVKRAFFIIFRCFQKGKLKKNDFFHLCGSIKIEPSIQTYYMYTSNKKLEIYLDPPKDRIGLRFNL